MLWQTWPYLHLSFPSNSIIKLPWVPLSLRPSPYSLSASSPSLTGHWPPTSNGQHHLTLTWLAIFVCSDKGTSIFARNDRKEILVDSSRPLVAKGASFLPRCGQKTVRTSDPSLFLMELDVSEAKFIGRSENRQVVCQKCPSNIYLCMPFHYHRQKKKGGKKE